MGKYKQSQTQKNLMLQIRIVQAKTGERVTILFLRFRGYMS